MLRFQDDSPSGFAEHELQWLEPAREGRRRGVRLRSLESWATGSSQAFVNSLLERGYFKSPPAQVRTHWVLGTALFSQVALAIRAYPDGVTLAKAGAAGLAWAILYLFVRRIVPRTRRGARALDQAFGFKQWLSEVELSQVHDPGQARRIFERYLPYAIVLGQEARWARAFSSQPPAFDWYQGLAGEPMEAGVLTSRLCSAVPRYPWRHMLYAMAEGRSDD